MSTALSFERPAPAAEPTIGAGLRRRRLEHRIARLERVVVALRDRAVYREAHGEVPEPLRQAIAGFAAELRDLRSQL